MMYELQPGIALPGEQLAGELAHAVVRCVAPQELGLSGRDRSGLPPRSRTRAHGPEPGRSGGFGLDLALLIPVKVAVGFGEAP